MQEARDHQRITCRLTVDLICDSDMSRYRGRTRDIGMSGLFVTAATSLKINAIVFVELILHSGDRRRLKSRVARIESNGVALEFIESNQATTRGLQALLSPEWSGGSILEGVLKIAPWYRHSELSGWMRLTSSVSDWPRLTQRA